MKKIVEFINFDMTFLRKNLPLIVFVTIALIGGMVFIKNIGAFAGSDLRGAHYPAALALATGQSFNEPWDQSEKYPGADGKRHTIVGREDYFLSSVGICEKPGITDSIITKPLEPDYLYDCQKKVDDTLSSSRNTEVEAIIQYPPVNYIPQAAALRIGMDNDMDAADAQRLARVFNLFVYVVMIAAAIRLAPRGKWLLVILGLLPTSLFLASSLSCDGLNIAWCFLFVAFVARLYVQKTKITKKQLAALIILGFGLFVLKVAYTPLLLLILSLRKRVLPPVFKWTLFSGIFITGCITYLVWSSNWSSLNAAADLPVNTDIVLNNLPQAAIGILINIFSMPMELFEIKHSMYLGLTLAIFAGVLFSLRNVQPLRVNKFLDFVSAYRLILLGIAAAVISVGLTYAALLVTWTEIPRFGYIDIKGFQGRYVLPLLPLIILVYYLPQRIVRKTLTHDK